MLVTTYVLLNTFYKVTFKAMYVDNKNQTEKKFGHLKAYNMSVVIINRANKIDFAFCGNLGWFLQSSHMYICLY